MSTTFIESVIIMLISGAYLVAQPQIYRRGLIWLFPPSKHARAGEIFDDIAAALPLWLLGQLVEMALIGVLTTFAVWIVGVPSPLALGLIAAIGEFIPYLGPILAAIPAVLVAITKTPETAMWTIIAYIVIHQFEGQIITPLIQRHIVAIPPVVMVLGIVAITYLFAAIAIILAAPIAIVIFTAVNVLRSRASWDNPAPAIYGPRVLPRKRAGLYPAFVPTSCAGWSASICPGTWARADERRAQCGRRRQYSQDAGCERQDIVGVVRGPLSGA